MEKEATTEAEKEIKEGKKPRKGLLKKLEKKATAGKPSLKIKRTVE